KVSYVKPDQWLSVFGMCGLGNLALQYARNVIGAKNVDFGINDDKLEFAKELGADDSINSKDVDPVAEVMKLTDN
ncbi:zinc-binding dehydrogenase, partial [Staphylococcus aureus]